MYKCFFELLQKKNCNVCKNWHKTVLIQLSTFNISSYSTHCHFLQLPKLSLPWCFINTPHFLPSEYFKRRQPSAGRFCRNHSGINRNCKHDMVGPSHKKIWLLSVILQRQSWERLGGNTWEHRLNRVFETFCSCVTILNVTWFIWNINQVPATEMSLFIFRGIIKVNV